MIPEEDIDSPLMEEFVKKVEPGHILAFTTGANRIPAGGFSTNPHIRFVHQEGKVNPSANTCSCELLLFVNEQTVTNAFF